MSKTPVFQTIAPSGYAQSRWAGGTTTQLFIYPQGADFKLRDFLFRISTATVEAEESVFTPLPDVARTLMLLEGAMNLHHEGRHESRLKPFEQDVFDGGWRTTSKGRCADFNLMTREGCSGTLEAVHIAENESVSLQIKEVGFLFAHLYSGSLLLPDDSVISEGHSLFAEGVAEISVKAQSRSILIKASIVRAV